MEEIEATVAGRVQMVMFRDFAQRKARGLGILGFVTNNLDGTVTVRARGEKKKLEVFVEFLKKGSFFSKVESVSAKQVPIGQESFTDFSIRY